MVPRAQLARAAAGETLRIDRRVTEVEGTTRMLLVPAGGEAAVAVIGQSLADRDETLRSLVTSFAIGGAISVALATLLGYLIALADTATGRSRCAGRATGTGSCSRWRTQGPGFAPEVADRAFERFARGDASRARTGAGLGLALVRAIAEAHGGRR